MRVHRRAFTRRRQSLVARRAEPARHATRHERPAAARRRGAHHCGRWQAERCRERLLASEEVAPHEDQ
eukprot:scaffold125558_cov36-Phaeocystis_antarctica.AAC.1